MADGQKPVHYANVKRVKKSSGKCISNAEVTQISKHGFWLLVADEELSLSFTEFPWLEDAAVSEILNVA